MARIFIVRALKNSLDMVIYTVLWSHDSVLAKGKGRTKDSENLCAFSVICRNRKDAVACLDYHFNHVFRHRSNVSIDDGEVILRRATIDSRGFTANYLMMDGIREPISLSDLKSNINRINSIF